MEQQNELNRQLGETLQQIKEHQENILAGQQDEGEEVEGNEIPQEETPKDQDEVNVEEQKPEETTDKQPKGDGENN